MIFGERIKKLREENGLSQKNIAEKIGISDVSLGRYERGAVKAPQDEAIYEKLAKALGCSKEYLKGETEETGSAAAVKKGKNKASKAEKAEKTEKTEKSAVSKKTAASGKAARSGKNEEPSQKAKAEKAGKAGKASMTGEAAVNIELQYGDMSVTYEELMRRAREAAGGAAQAISLYVKPEEGRAYFVAGDESGSFKL